MWAVPWLAFLALYGFVRSLVDHWHDPSWGWLCVFLGAVLLAEAGVVHRLLRERDGSGKIQITPQELAEYGKHMQAKESAPSTSHGVGGPVR